MRSQIHWRTAIGVLVVGLLITVTHASAADFRVTPGNNQSTPTLSDLVTMTPRCSSCGANTPLTLEQADTVDVDWFSNFTMPTPFHIDEGQLFGPQAFDRGEDVSVELGLSTPDKSSESNGANGSASDSDHQGDNNSQGEDADDQGLRYTANISHDTDGDGDHDGGHDGDDDGHHDSDHNGDGDHASDQSIAFSLGDSGSTGNGGSAGLQPLGVDGGSGAGSGSGGGSGQTLVPEPASLVLFGTGLSVVAFRNRRRIGKKAN